MANEEIRRMNDMRDAGIFTTQIYMHFAEQSGGFENVRFRRKDMYNQIEKQRQLMESDVTETLKLEQWGLLVGDGSYESRIAAMNDELEGLPFAAYGDLGDFKDVMEWVRNKKAELFAKHEKNREGSSNSAGEKFKTRTDATSKEAGDKKKKCNGIGHNRQNCRRGDDHNQMESRDGGGPEDDDDWSSQTSEEGIDEIDFDVTIGNQKGKYH
ncbi:hypothetical protein HN51_047818 [Arachis hypogaea]